MCGYDACLTPIHLFRLDDAEGDLEMQWHVIILSDLLSTI